MAIGVLQSLISGWDDYFNLCMLQTASKSLLFPEKILSMCETHAPYPVPYFSDTQLSERQLATLKCFPRVRRRGCKTPLGQKELHPESTRWCLRHCLAKGRPQLVRKLQGAVKQLDTRAFAIYSVIPPTCTNPPCVYT
eukprot:1158028-Pelagomonas_calceolata.AAC.5